MSAPTAPRDAVLTKPLRQAIERGHPWVYDRAVRLPADAAAGDLRVLRDEHGPLARVLVEPGSPIACRILDLDLRAPIDARWAQARAAAAATARARDPLLAGCDGMRLIHGENDRLPGLVIDRYGPVLVAVFDGPAAERFWTPLLPAVLAGIASAGFAADSVWVRASRGAGRDQAYAMSTTPPALVEIHEGAARFAVDVRAGQKTGFFLDQRRNRQLVAELAAGQRVLNVFSYTGGFSVHAALGGATRVTSVDIAAPAIAQAADNFRRSGLDPAVHEFVADDAFAFFTAATAARRTWDVVITDPPSFAPSEATRGRGLAAYRRIASAALDTVAPGGLLGFASCSSHITESDLLEVLAQAGAAAGRPLRLRAILGAASDHPTLPAFPEGRYLNFLLADVA